ncbi:putative small multi-drug export protein [Melghiribacillus thermohalophilus]|uniref:Putative small multi-drug export protein n=1 Tax=Melghiribacillus thermohalophilus TaxID=1324956 RepID=A0A4R3N5P3_9BACI|nr:small multi-drug export protein [Melghiribacillus thermohalophilus]TCT23406.1 putative small multi-drug export protein [Melghiribacillus thermohalophilus]
MKLILGYVSVFLLAAVPFFEAYGVIPIAAIAGLPVVLVTLLGLAGNLLTVFLLLAFIDQFQNWRRSRKQSKDLNESKRSKRAQKIWRKYGLPGLALLGPLVVGSHLTALASMSFGGAKKKTFVWITASITLWSITFTVLLYNGVDFLGLKDRGIINYFQ